MTNNEKVELDNTNEEEVEDVDTQDTEYQDDSTVQLTQEEYNQLKKAEDDLRVANQKAQRFQKERDRIKGKTKTDDQSESLAEQSVLMAAGYRDKAEREEISKLANNLGISVLDAIDDEFVTSRIEHMRKQAEIAEATPISSKKGVKKTSNNVDYWVEKGELPTDNPKLRMEVVRAKRERAKQSSKFYNN